MPLLHIWFAFFILELIYQFVRSWQLDDSPLEWIAGAVAALAWPITLYFHLRQSIED